MKNSLQDAFTSMGLIHDLKSYLSVHPQAGVSALRFEPSAENCKFLLKRKKNHEIKWFFEQVQSPEQLESILEIFGEDLPLEEAIRKQILEVSFFSPKAIVKYSSETPTREGFYLLESELPSVFERNYGLLSSYVTSEDLTHLSLTALLELATMVRARDRGRVFKEIISRLDEKETQAFFRASWEGKSEVYPSFKSGNHPEAFKLWIATLNKENAGLYEFDKKTVQRYYFPADFDDALTVFNFAHDETAKDLIVAALTSPNDIERVSDWGQELFKKADKVKMKKLLPQVKLDLSLAAIKFLAAVGYRDYAFSDSVTFGDQAYTATADLVEMATSGQYAKEEIIKLSSSLNIASVRENFGLEYQAFYQEYIDGATLVEASTHFTSTLTPTDLLANTLKGKSFKLSNADIYWRRDDWADIVSLLPVDDPASVSLHEMFKEAEAEGERKRRLLDDLKDGEDVSLIRSINVKDEKTFKHALLVLGPLKVNKANLICNGLKSPSFNSLDFFKEMKEENVRLWTYALFSEDTYSNTHELTRGAEKIWKETLYYLLTNFWSNWDRSNGNAMRLAAEWISREIKDASTAKSQYIFRVLPQWEGTLAALFKGADKLLD